MAAITETAERQLIEVGPTQLSVRAVARELGMASSAIYRYVGSRDELLTLLIVDAYNDMAEHVEERSVRIRDPRKRWRTVGLASRSWALTEPQRFALIYGSPVPGYAAPEDTIGPATRIPTLLVGILQEAHVDTVVPAFTARVARSLRPALEGIHDWFGLQEKEFSDAAFAVGVMAWTHIIGSISFELFGHRHNVVGDSQADRKAYFEFELGVLADVLGIN
jgi:AcrR family transcriptional regulator